MPPLDQITTVVEGKLLADSLLSEYKAARDDILSQLGKTPATKVTALLEKISANESKFANACDQLIQRAINIQSGNEIITKININKKSMEHDREKLIDPLFSMKGALIVGQYSFDSAPVTRTQTKVNGWKTKNSKLNETLQVFQSEAKLNCENQKKYCTVNGLNRTLLDDVTTYKPAATTESLVAKSNFIKKAFKHRVPLPDKKENKESKQRYQKLMKTMDNVIACSTLMDKFNADLQVFLKEAETAPNPTGKKAKNLQKNLVALDKKIKHSSLDPSLKTSLGAELLIGKRKLDEGVAAHSTNQYDQTVMHRFRSKLTAAFNDKKDNRTVLKILTSLQKEVVKERKKLSTKESAKMNQINDFNTQVLDPVLKAVAILNPSKGQPDDIDATKAVNKAKKALTNSTTSRDNYLGVAEKLTGMLPTLTPQTPVRPPVSPKTRTTAKIIPELEANLARLFKDFERCQFDEIPTKLTAMETVFSQATKDLNAANLHPEKHLVIEGQIQALAKNSVVAIRQAEAIVRNYSPPQQDTSAAMTVPRAKTLSIVNDLEKRVGSNPLFAPIVARLQNLQVDLAKKSSIMNASSKPESTLSQPVDDESQPTLKKTVDYSNYADLPDFTLYEEANLKAMNNLQTAMKAISAGRQLLTNQSVRAKEPFDMDAYKGDVVDLVSLYNQAIEEKMNASGNTKEQSAAISDMADEVAYTIGFLDELGEFMKVGQAYHDKQGVTAEQYQQTCESFQARVMNDYTDYVTPLLEQHLQDEYKDVKMALVTRRTPTIEQRLLRSSGTSPRPPAGAGLSAASSADAGLESPDGAHVDSPRFKK